ncbi:hypothetical protein RchiOBHm_Chr4g0389521 [Rosa chinensis]|uniref:Uncharacterized protein n=1 Tax=Rosa chinensis TaxID=74649 RepID=A0A2P6QQ16_ROSCH|nr:hypothetical protein RchiOBHm_Chr4g0389521 [Rosa chinensis]
MEIELETEIGCQSSKRRRSCAIDGLISMSRFCTRFSAFEIGSAAAGLFPITVLGLLVVCRNEKQVQFFFW